MDSVTTSSKVSSLGPALHSVHDGILTRQEVLWGHHVGFKDMGYLTCSMPLSSPLLESLYPLWDSMWIFYPTCTFYIKFQAEPKSLRFRTAAVWKGQLLSPSAMWNINSAHVNTSHCPSWQIKCTLPDLQPEFSVASQSLLLCSLLMSKVKYLRAAWQVEFLHAISWFPLFRFVRKKREGETTEAEMENEAIDVSLRC